MRDESVRVDIGKKALKKLGKRIRELRESEGWSQEHLASLLDVEQTYISRIERGVRCPSVPKLAHIARAFRLSMSELMKDI